MYSVHSEVIAAVQAVPWRASARTVTPSVPLPVTSASQQAYCELTLKPIVPRVARRER